MNEVNSYAAKDFLTNFSEATWVRWIRGNDIFIARFNSGNSTGRAYYKKNGNFTYCIKYDPVDELDKNLKSAIFEKFPGCKIMIVKEVTDLEKRAFYINIKSGEFIKTLLCNDDGIQVTEIIKDAGIRFDAYPLALVWMGFMGEYSYDKTGIFPAVQSLTKPITRSLHIKFIIYFISFSFKPFVNIL